MPGGNSLDPLKVPIYNQRDPLGNIEELTLDSFRVSAISTFSPEFIERMEWDTWREVLGGLTVKLEGTVFAEQLADEKFTIHGSVTAHLPFPTSPWQFLKQRHRHTWWLGWLVRRWRVRTEYHNAAVDYRHEVRNKQFAMFPDSPIRTPDKYRGPRIVRWERTDYR